MIGAATERELGRILPIDVDEDGDLLPYAGVSVLGVMYEPLRPRAADHFVEGWLAYYIDLHTELPAPRRAQTERRATIAGIEAAYQVTSDRYRYELVAVGRDQYQLVPKEPFSLDVMDRAGQQGMMAGRVLLNYLKIFRDHRKGDGWPGCSTNRAIGNLLERDEGLAVTPDPANLEAFYRLPERAERWRHPRNRSAIQGSLDGYRDVAHLWAAWHVYAQQLRLYGDDMHALREANGDSDCLHPLLPGSDPDLGDGCLLDFLALAETLFAVSQREELRRRPNEERLPAAIISAVRAWRPNEDLRGILRQKMKAAAVSLRRYVEQAPI